MFAPMLGKIVKKTDAFVVKPTQKNNLHEKIQNELTNPNKLFSRPAKFQNFRFRQFFAFSSSNLQNIAEKGNVWITIIAEISNVVKHC